MARSSVICVYFALRAHARQWRVTASVSYCESVDGRGAAASRSTTVSLSVKMTPPVQTSGDEQTSRQLALPRIFSSELRQMMSGFGDSQNPRAESVKLMEEIVLEYICALNAKSTEVAACNKRERADLMDVMYVIRRDTRRLNRVRYLLEMKAEIKKATALNAEEVSKGG